MYVTVNLEKLIVRTSGQSKTELSAGDILSTYTEQECIENLFKVIKNPDHFSVRPQFHRTDQKIHVHVMLCMFAVAAAEVLRKKMEENGLVYTKEPLIEILQQFMTAGSSVT